MAVRTPKAGRTQALRLYPPGPCSLCGHPRGERHHIDGNPINNAASNIAMLCRRCHMTTDGRLEQFSAEASRRAARLVVIAAEAKRALTTCKRGHPLSGTNLYVSPEGKRVCRTCRTMHKHNYRARGGVG